MRALETIAHTIKIGKVHPTTVVNTLIEVENEGGTGALRRVERHLALSEEALRERAHPHSRLARAWLDATRAYLVAHAECKRAV
ncbi:hypothetical protein [Deinococcus peraridilitoris]|uniref:Uncharacterized protein n=1 Tax=Deinococcus peraridilitoris (strain DSM 19664 / LMG 22246 / CIP 109416 / KR-200) TaxID=937777 RepID=K9ZZQ9_DEIPD|nr:hypothetical protein [Deinococcus peraridilitoris]AFZ66674.1 hypothetical protein Deipe_1112 [Deinococcus peraridilitoris DSM 19664]